MVSVSDSLSAISNDKSLVLFNTIALATEDSSILIGRLRLTRKQFYSRMSELTKAGLIRRRNGKYFLTSFGRSSRINRKCYSIHFPDEERNKLINTLINNSEIKEILVSRHRNNNIPAEKEIAHNKEIIVSALSAQACNSIYQSSHIYTQTDGS
jgi:hypothetical protein